MPLKNSEARSFVDEWRKGMTTILVSFPAQLTIDFDRAETISETYCGCGEVNYFERNKNSNNKRADEI